MPAPEVRFGVVSDIHGNLPALQAVVADAGAVDAWLNLGDILSGPLWPAETADWLMARQAEARWHTMAGNHERQVLTFEMQRMSEADHFTAQRLSAAHRAWLAGLPAELHPSPGLLCVHGTPHSDLIYLLETVEPQGLRAAMAPEVAQRLAGVRAALVLCGHSHLPRDVQIEGTRVANPGSVGLQAYDDDHLYRHVAETGSPHARYALVHSDEGRWSVELRQVAYDHEAAAAQAQANGRPDWAFALRTGRAGSA